jgi:hypothetical protein
VRARDALTSAAWKAALLALRAVSWLGMTRPSTLVALAPQRIVTGPRTSSLQASISRIDSLN